MLSAVIITYNEERNIARCLDSLVAIADEIIVVDSFSTDQTEDICKERGVTFLQHAFGGHIEQKNYAMAQASHDHILSLDADEALTPTLRKSILAIKEGLGDEAYSFNRLTSYCGHWVRHCGWYPDKKLRIWNRKHGRWGGANPHDKLIVDEGISVIHLSGDLEHWSFYTIDQHMDQIHYFTDISSKAAFDIGRRSSILKMLYKPGFKFFQSYFLKLGFLDGYYGLVICVNSTYAKYLKYKKLYRLGKD